MLKFNPNSEEKLHLLEFFLVPGVRTIDGMRSLMLLLLFGSLTLNGMRAAEPAFDLAGPKVDVHVKRGEVTLPIGQVPNLLPGDRLWIHPDLPESQSAHYVLVVAFLRGATNPPPQDWFTRVETWSREAREEGVFVTVPDEAQQALIFLAPETGGDFSTLCKAVRGRPGAFVRATQDLQAASLDRMRMDAYLAAVRAIPINDPKMLKERAELVARSLGVKLDPQCFEKPADQQAACLGQLTAGMVMDDSNAQSLVNQLASGSTLDLVNQIGYSSMAGGGAYSPYFGAIVDTAKILASLHTAHFQYIPALALPTKDTLNLRLNMPPSFRDPKSVVVVALPPVGPSKPPVMHALNPAQSLCVQAPNLVLATDGVPVLFSTSLAYGLTLHIDGKGGSIQGEMGKAGAAVNGAIDLPLKPDAEEGGLVLDNALPPLPLAEGELTGVVRGKWGFDDWEGPRFKLRTPQVGKWTLNSSDQTALVVGREDTLHIEGANSQCVDRIEMQAGSGEAVKVPWKSPKPETLEVELPMKDATPGPVNLEIYQFGLQRPDNLAMNAYAEAASLERLTLSAGDKDAELKGTRLDEVAKAEMNGITWTPSALTRVQDADQLTMSASGSTTGLEAGKRSFAKVQLRDGRQLKVPVDVATARPQVDLLSKGSQEDTAAVPSPVHLGSPDDFLLENRLVFFLKSRVPTNFPRNEKVEIAAVDGSFSTTLSTSDGSIILEDAKTAVGTIDPLARFGGSAFGPLQLRAVSADGIPGAWMPLGTLVRLPGFKELHCPHSTARTCTLSGTNLFLAASIGSTPDFDNATDVPLDFAAGQLSIPHPANGVLYVKLRDDPATVQTLTLPVMTPAPSATSNVPLAAPAPAATTQPPAGSETHAATQARTQP